ncbi:hypothetical protein STEG23_028835 [Scotinomys teguina]
MTLSCSPCLDDTMDLDGSAGHSDQHGPSGHMALGQQHGHRFQPRPRTSVWPMVATQATDINMDPGYYRTIDPDKVLSSSPGPVLTMAPGGGGSTAHSDWHGPSDNMALGHQHGLSIFCFSFSPVSPPHYISTYLPGAARPVGVFSQPRLGKRHYFSNLADCGSLDVIGPHKLIRSGTIKSGDIHIPAASTAMEKLLWCSLIIISFSQAFVQKDMSGTAMVFPKESDNSYVILEEMSKKSLKAFTVCLRIYTDLSTTRSFSIFSYATKKNPNEILIFWHKDRGYTLAVGEREVLFKVSKTPVTPTHICASWESATGIVEFWVDGKPNVRKSLQKGYTMGTDASIILGQEQDSYGGRFDAKQSFVGDIGNVNMWDTVLSPEQINIVSVGGTVSPNVLNWKALKYKAQGYVVMKPQLWS